MGLFDTVRCEYPLPNPQHQDLEFQTKDLECFLAHYTITRDGRLILHARQGKPGPDRDIEWPIHGDIQIYTSEKEVWIEYVVRFTRCVEWIKPVEEVPPPPEVPPLEVDLEFLPEWSELLKSKRKHDPLLPSAAADSVEVPAEWRRLAGHKEMKLAQQGPGRRCPKLRARYWLVQ